MDDLTKTHIQAEVEVRAAEVFRKEASMYREFLEKMFSRVLWAISILLVAAFGLGAWMFGESVESAANSVTTKLLSETAVKDDIVRRVQDAAKNEADAAIIIASTDYRKKVGDEAKKIVEASIETDVKPVLEKRIAELRNMTPQQLAQVGLKGTPGQRGPPGPEWKPTVKISNRLVANRSSDLELGNALACYLVEAGTVHANQACTCSVEQDPASTRWVLRLGLDPKTNGKCSCQAACLS